MTKARRAPTRQPSTGTAAPASRRPWWQRPPAWAGSGLLLPLAVGAAMLLAQHRTPLGTTPKTARLEVVDTVVTGGQQQVRVSDPPSVPQTIDVTLRNVGDTTSVVKRALFTVRAFDRVKVCEAGGPMEPTKQYDLMLPQAPNIGQTIELKVSQQIAPDEADRFTFSLGVRDHQLEDGAFIYQLDVLLAYDTAAQPLRAGTVVVAAPYTPQTQDFWEGEAPPGSFDPAYKPVEQLPCYGQNRQAYLRMLALDAARVPELTQ